VTSPLVPRQDEGWRPRKGVGMASSAVGSITSAASCLSESLGEHVRELGLVPLGIVILRIESTERLAELPVGHHGGERLLEQPLEMTVSVSLCLTESPADGLVLCEVQSLDVDIHIAPSTRRTTDMATIKTSVKSGDIHRHARSAFCGAFLDSREAFQDHVEGRLTELQPHLERGGMVKRGEEGGVTCSRTDDEASPNSSHCSMYSQTSTQWSIKMSTHS
jgi:hypothetical protein